MNELLCGIFFLCIGCLFFRAVNKGFKKKKYKRRTTVLLAALALASFIAIGCLPENQQSSSQKETASSESETTVEPAAASGEETENSASVQMETSQEPTPDSVPESEDPDTTFSGEEEIIAETPSAGILEITMLDVHQGLSILINADGHYMLYDGGGRSRSSYVVAYLSAHGIDSLDYVVASHYDEDHIAGLVGVLNKFYVRNILCPDYEHDTKIYSSLMNTVKSKAVNVFHPDAGQAFPFGNAQFTILSADSEADSDNDKSIVVRLVSEDRGFSCMFTGDAEKDAETNILYSGYAVDSDLYIAGHHGSASSSSAQFLNAVKPSCVWISCGAENSYGHPAEQAMERLKATGADMYRTDIQGEVTVRYENGNVSYSTDPCTDWTPGSQKPETEKEQASPSISGTDGTGETENETAPSAATTYILNTSSKKIHYQNCPSVKQIKDSNMAVSDKSRDELIAEGYKPCGNCTP